MFLIFFSIDLKAWGYPTLLTWCFINFNDYYENKPFALIFDIIVSDFNILKQCKSQTLFLGTFIFTPKNIIYT